MWVPAAEARSFCTDDPAGRVVPATGEYWVPPGEEGEGPRHLASAQKSQHNYPAKALRAVGDGVGQAEPLARAFQLSPSTATETKKKRVRPPPLVPAAGEPKIGPGVRFFFDHPVLRRKGGKTLRYFTLGFLLSQ